MKTRRVEPLEAVWLLAALLVPLWINLWGGHPFDLAKSLLLRALVWIGVAAWLLTPGQGRALPPAVRWATVALASAWLVATATAANLSLSWWGSIGRNLGAITLIALLCLFILVATRLRGPDAAHRLVWALVITAIPIVALSLMQATGSARLPVISNAPSPILATLGRANFVAAYLAMLLPLIAALTLERAQTPLGRALMGLSFAVGSVLWLTRARAAWLSAAAGMAAFALLATWPRLRPHGRRRLLAGLGLALGLAGAAALAWLLRADAGSVAARRAIWQATWRLIRARPWFGYGPEALELVFPTVFPPQLVYYQGRGVLVDRAHNWLLDAWATTGLVGLLAWMALLLACLAACRQALRHAPNPAARHLPAAAAAAVLGNLVGNLAAFDTIATATTTWLLLGLVVALAPATPERNMPRPISGFRPPPSAIRLGQVVIALVALLFVTQTAIRPLLADNADWAAKRAARDGNWETAIGAATSAVERWPVEFVYYLDAAWICTLRVEQGEATPACLARAEDILLAARDLRPDDYRAHAALGELYALWAAYLDDVPLNDDHVAQAHAAYEGALALAPDLATLHVAQGQVYAQAGDWAGAAAAWRRAVDLDVTDARAHLLLGDAELAQGHTALAIEAYEDSLAWEPDQTAAYLGLARCYDALDQPVEAARWRTLAVEH